MAITITQEPGTVNAAYRPIVWKVTNDNSLIARIIADVKIDGVIKANIDKDPVIGTTNTFEFDVQNICQDFLTFDLETISGNSIKSADKSQLKVELDFYEVIDPGGGGALITAWEEDGSGTPDITGTEVEAINMTLQHTENQNMSQFLDDNTSKKFLTHAPLIQKIRRTETIQISYLSAASVAKFTLRQFSKTGSPVGVTPISTSLVNTRKGIIKLDANAMTSDTAKFTIALTDPGGFVVSETRTFEIDDRCEDTEIRLKWLNQLGGFDSYTFTGTQERSIKHKATSYEQLLLPTFNIQDRGETNLEIKANNEFNLWSQVRDTETIKWLEEALANKINVWIDDTLGFIPIIILDGSTKIENTEDPILQINLKYKFANELISQRN